MRILSFSLIAVVVLSIIGFGWILNKVYYYSSPQANAAENTIYTQMGHQIYSQFSVSENKNAFVDHWNKNGDIYLSLNERDDFPVPEALLESFNRGQALVLESESGIGVHYALPETEQVFTIALPGPEERRTTKLELILTLCFYGGITTIIIIWIWPLIHHLLQLRDTAVKFGRGDLNARVKPQRFSYIADIEQEFDRMAERIQSLVQDNKLLSSAVSHDLKTPLARLRFGLDALSETQDAEKRERYADRVNNDLEAMENLIDTLLQYARLDENLVKIAAEEICLVRFSQKLINSQNDGRIEIEFYTPLDTATIQADKRYLSMLINNLLSNALRYTHSRVKVSLIEENKNYLLSFEDNGKGIPKAERENVTKPFWRGDQGRATKGHGMGLAIVDRIAEWHQAKLEIDESESLGGAKISLRFPLDATANKTA